MSKFYVYIHRRGDTKEVFYVGKGCNGRAKSKSSRNCIWNRIVNKGGYSVEIVSKNLNESLAYQIEETLIALYKINNLAKANISSGGPFGASGIKCPDHVRVINSGKNSKVSKKVIDIVTGQTWDTISQAAIDNNIKQPVLSRKLNGTRYNNTNLKYIREE